ncbi:MAG: toll/interleukin-1 receptor domain-containing protein [Cytophagales bacterium]|nr:toll/interleukin-1 receptor domain-containing protein [Cytophagales bacterium]
MGYVQDEQHDVFISFAHIDNRPLEGMDKGWVSTFYSNLKNFLTRKLGNGNVSLWMDHKLDGNAPLTPAIMQALQETATLIVVVSQGYLNSEWCKKERETFLSLVANRSRADSRVFVVEIDKVARNERPAAFRDLRGYYFWVQQGGEEGPVRTLANPEPEPEYWDRLLRLSNDLATELKRLKQSAWVPQPMVNPPLPAGPQGPAVFLAETTEDLEEQREEVKGYLKQAGLRVLPESYYPRDHPAAFREMVVKDLAPCKLFVQLLSGIAGRKAAGFAAGYPGLQHDCAVQAGKPVLQWRSREVELEQIKDGDYRSLLEGSTVRTTGLEEFKRTVLEEALRTPKPPPDPSNIFVFVNADAPDRDLAQSIGKWLFDRGIDYAMPLAKGDPSHVREDLEDNLRACDAAVIVYGATSVGWVRRQLLQSRKISSERNKPLSALVVFEGPPPVPLKDDLDMKMMNLRTVRSHAALDEAVLEHLVNNLRNGYAI